MNIFRTVSVSETNGNFSRKSQNFPNPVYFAPPLRGFPLDLGVSPGAAWSQETRVMRLAGLQRRLTISSAVWIQCPNVTDGRTDRQTDTGRQQRPRLRLASRGKKTIRARNKYDEDCYFWEIQL